MMMIMVYALHDEKEEREILKKIKIIYFNNRNKGYCIQYFIICVTASINISINNILLISFKGNVRMCECHSSINVQIYS